MALAGNSDAFLKGQNIRIPGERGARCEALETPRHEKQSGDPLAPPTTPWAPSRHRTARAIFATAETTMELSYRLTQKGTSSCGIVIYRTGTVTLWVAGAGGGGPRIAGA